MSAASIRLLLADDQALVRGALAALLSLEPDLEVVAEVGSGLEVLPAAVATDPTWPCSTSRCPGWTASPPAAVRGAFPDTRVLIVTTFGRPGFLHRAMKSGASGFVVKDTPAAQLADACAGCTPGCGSSTRHWPPTAWWRGSRR